MKHIKLFENWAEEIEVPEYLDPDTGADFIGDGYKRTYTIFRDEIINELQQLKCNIGIGNLGYGSKLCLNFKSFLELEGINLLRPDGYNELHISQANCQYKLQDLEGLPAVSNALVLVHTDIKSLRGLENKKFKKLTLIFSKLENLKYCPEAEVFDFGKNPLLSLMGIKIHSSIVTIENRFADNSICNMYAYRHPKEFTRDEIINTKFHADAFCNFEKFIKDDDFAYKFKFQPWNLIYNDPNDVSNFDFLFHPFWQASEKFREKAQQYIKNLDMTRVTRSKEELW